MTHMIALSVYRREGQSYVPHCPSCGLAHYHYSRRYECRDQVCQIELADPVQLLVLKGLRGLSHPQQRAEAAQRVATCANPEKHCTSQLVMGPSKPYPYPSGRSMSAFGRSSVCETGPGTEFRA